MSLESFEQIDLTQSASDLSDNEGIILQDFLGNGPDIFFHCQSSRLGQG